MNKRKMKNIVLKTITTIMAILFLVSASALDMVSRIPSIVCVISIAYLSLFALANRKALRKWEK